MLGETFGVEDSLDLFTVDLERGSRGAHQTLRSIIRVHAYEGTTNTHTYRSAKQLMHYMHGETDRVPPVDVWRAIIESCETFAFAYEEGRSVVLVQPMKEFDHEVQSKLQYATEPHPVSLDDVPEGFRVDDGGGE